MIPIQLAIASWQAPQPQAIFTLGGGIDREEFTAQFASAFPSLDIWVSSGVPSNLARPVYQNAGITDDRLHLDYRAIDTVTNFTTFVPEFQKRKIKHIYLITSDFHMARAKAIAILILGSQGITFTPIVVPTNEPKESMLRILRDSGRSILWIVTRCTGANLNPRYKSLLYASR
ncbi:YdcF family protein [Dulcicalothrix desertica]